VGVGLGIDGVLVHAGTLSLSEARSCKYVPGDSEGGEPNKDDGVALGDLTEEALICAKGTDSGG
jgi:hypothetical protein